MKALLMPKLRHNFIVQLAAVANDDGTVPDVTNELNSLEDQVVGVDIGTEILTPGALSHKSSRIVLWLEDDAACRVMKSIRRLQHNTVAVDVSVYLLDNMHRICERFTFKSAHLEALQHSMLSYEDTADKLDIDLPDGGKCSGIIAPATAKVASMKLLQLMFTDGMEHEIFETAMPLESIGVDKQ